jgi:hypothetical protein
MGAFALTALLESKFLSSIQDPLGQDKKWDATNGRTSGRAPSRRKRRRYDRGIHGNKRNRLGARWQHPHDACMGEGGRRRRRKREKKGFTALAIRHFLLQLTCLEAIGHSIYANSGRKS